MISSFLGWTTKPSCPCEPSSNLFDYMKDWHTWHLRAVSYAAWIEWFKKHTSATIHHRFTSASSSSPSSASTINNGDSGPSACNAHADAHANTAGSMHGAAGGGEVTGRYAEARTTLYAPITGLGVEIPIIDPPPRPRDALAWISLYLLFFGFAYCVVRKYTTLLNKFPPELTLLTVILNIPLVVSATYYQHYGFLEERNVRISQVHYVLAGYAASVIAVWIAEKMREGYGLQHYHHNARQGGDGEETGNIADANVSVQGYEIEGS